MSGNLNLFEVSDLDLDWQCTGGEDDNDGSDDDDQSDDDDGDCHADCKPLAGWADSC